MRKDEPAQEHLAITDYLIERIVNQEIRPKQKIPSLNQLAEQFKVNKNVVRRAIARLENLGWVTPSQGRGSYVNEQPGKISSLLTRHNRYTNLMIQYGEKLNSHLLDWRLDEPNPVEAEALALSAAERVYRLEILRFAGKSPLSLATCSLPEKKVPHLERYLSDFRSLHGLLEDRYQFRPIRQISVIEARMPLNREPEYLEIPENIPVLWMKNINVHPDGEPVELVLARCRGDRYQCVVDFEKIESMTLQTPQPGQ